MRRWCTRLAAASASPALTISNSRDSRVTSTRLAGNRTGSIAKNSRAAAVARTTRRSASRSSAMIGAAATLPGPFYDKAFLDYSIRYPQVKVKYQAVGSGAGIQQFIKKTVDFGASDVPMGTTDIASAGGETALTQIPTTLGVVSIAFN